ncbi:MAG: phosphoribosylglycinamide formyltransferase [Bacteroidota bacterium]
MIFASGNGSNAENIIKYFEKSKTIKVSLIVCNKPYAGVLDVAKHYSIPTLIVTKQTIENLAFDWKNVPIDLIVLAGFLWQIPSSLTQSFQNKIINIHPSLLPKYGGKGMFGNAVHKAVIENHEAESGITIHFVNEHYDEGKIIFQSKISLEKNETVESLCDKIHQLEYQYLPLTIEKILQ